MDVQIKTFRIADANDERAFNNFLKNKMIRHWSTSLAGDSADTSNGAVWNVFVAYEERMEQTRGAAKQNDRKQGGGRQADDKRKEPRDQNRTTEPRETPVKEKAPREDYVPNLSEEDLPLFEALRKWRNARARDERVKPFSFFNNRQLEEVVKAKPTEVGPLRALIPDMEERLFERYHNELLGFLGGSMTNTTALTEPTDRPVVSEAAA